MFCPQRVMAYSAPEDRAASVFSRVLSRSTLPQVTSQKHGWNQVAQQHQRENLKPQGFIPRVSPGDLSSLEGGISARMVFRNLHGHAPVAPNRGAPDVAVCKTFPMTARRPSVPNRIILGASFLPTRRIPFPSIRRSSFGWDQPRITSTVCRPLENAGIPSAARPSTSMARTPFCT